MCKSELDLTPVKVTHTMSLDVPGLIRGISHKCLGECAKHVRLSVLTTERECVSETSETSQM